jgi:hypothetical protein
MLRSLVEAVDCLAFFITPCTPGKSTAARIPIIAITVSNSIRVKPLRLVEEVDFILGVSKRGELRGQLDR